MADLKVNGLLSFLGRSLRGIEDGSSLTEGDLLIVDPKPEHRAGIAIENYDWLIRPGDLVPVSFELGSLSTGIYVPVEAVSTLNGAASVFVVDGKTVRKKAVTIHDSVGGLRRIEGEGITSGAKIVVTGHHYIADGNEVNVVEVRKQ